MSGLGFSIMNDRYYPELLPKQEDDLDNPLQLIARKVKFVDPVSGKKMAFESERELLHVKNIDEFSESAILSNYEFI